MNHDGEINESEIGNHFKMAQFLFLREQYDNSADKFENVCSFTKMYLLNQDKSPFLIEILLNSIYKLGEIYEKSKCLINPINFI